MVKRSDTPKFENEAALVAAFCALLDRDNQNPRMAEDEKWTAYHETAGWDLLLVNRKTGVQVGIEAKLALNPKVLTQALPENRWWDPVGPDYRAVLVPSPDCQHYLPVLARHLGIGVISARGDKHWRDDTIIWQFNPSLPNERYSIGTDSWPNWMPARRCELPEYVPDVTGGHAAPVALTVWKIKAIKLLILLERRGYVTRADMKVLQISPTRWTDNYHGFLSADSIKGGYVQNSRTPDLRAQHPTNYAQIESDFEKWGPEFMKAGGATGALFGGAAA